MYIARQPIFSKNLNIYGYELLFREEAYSKEFNNTSAKTATASVIGGLFEQGIEKVVESVKAFVNFDYDFIMSDMIELISPDTLVIEILETVKIDDVLLDRIRELQRKGYKFALDDFVNDMYSAKALPMIDIIKYDVILTPLDSIRDDVRKAIASRKIVLAEKIETEEAFIKAKEMGFQLFQGYFFCKPNVVIPRTKRVVSSSSAYARILNEVRKKDYSYDDIAQIISIDVKMSYQLLKILNNKRTKNNFSSIKDALVRMGGKEIERWACVFMLQDISTGKPDELLRLSLVRSKFSELIAKGSAFHKNADEISLLCLFSLIDAIVDEPMEQALSELPVTKEIVDTLLYGTGSYEPVCRLIHSYEAGDWEQVCTYAENIKMEPEELIESYLISIDWAKNVMNSYT